MLLVFFPYKTFIAEVDTLLKKRSSDAALVAFPVFKLRHDNRNTSAVNGYHFRPFSWYFLKFRVRIRSSLRLTVRDNTA